MKVAPFIVGLVLAASCGDSRQAPESRGKVASPATLLPAINNAPTLNTFVVYAGQNVTLGTGDQSLGGDIGVATAGASSPQLTVGSFDGLDPLRNLYSPSVTLGSGAVAGDIETNALQNNGGLFNTQAPYPSSMPPLPQIFPATPSGSNVTVSALQITNLTPGSYGNLTDNGIVNLAPGTYSFASITLGNNAQLVGLLGGSTSVLVSGSFTAGQAAHVLTNAGSAPHLAISVAGSDGPGGSPRAVSFGIGAQITALLAAPNGTISLADNVLATGAFAAQNFVAGNNVHLTFQEGFPIETPSLSTFVLYAESSVTLGTGDQSQGGDIGVAATSASTSGAQLAVGSLDVLDDDHALYAPSVSLANLSAVGDIASPTIQNSGGSFFAQVPFPASMPLLPLAPSGPAGTTNVNVALLQTTTLSPGNYGALVDNGILSLNPGTYSFTSVSVGPGAQLLALAGGATTIQISGALSTGQGAQILPPLQTAGNLTIFVSGSDGAGGSPPAVSLGTATKLTGLLAAPNGTASLGNGTQLTGAVAAFAITVGNNAALNFQTGFPATTTPAGTTLVNGYTVPPSSPVVSPVPGNTVVALALALPLKDLAGLQALVDASADPTSPTYRQHVSQTTLVNNYYPSASDYGVLTSWAQLHGFTSNAFANNIVLDVQGTAAQIEQALFVNLNYQSRPDGTVFFGPDRAPRSGIAVTLLSLEGLDNYVVPTPFVGGTAPLAGTFQSSDLRGAYLGSGTSCSGLQGAGQSIGLLEFDGFTATDITSYERQTNLMGVPTVQVQVTDDPLGRSPGCPSCPSGPLAPPLAPTAELGTVECSGDIEFAIAMAPQANVIAFEGTLGDSVLEDIASNPAVAQISSSWNVGTTNATQTLLTVIAAQGQSFFEASGDFGPYEPPTAFGACPMAATAPPPGGGNPTIQPPTDIRSLNFVTLVGGTLLTTNAGVRTAEAAWPSSAGGVFTGVSEPTYQMGSTANATVSTTNRNGPDVAAVAQNVFAVVTDCNMSAPAFAGSKVSPAQCMGGNSCTATGMTNILNACPAGNQTTGQSWNFNGTSASAPIWAGFTALANSQPGAIGTIGWSNPTIYQIGKSAQRYGQAFKDINDGSFTTNTCGLQFRAVNGYDLTTGWGSPQCGYMAQENARPKVTVGISGTAQGPIVCINGSGFSPGGTVTVQFAGIPEEPLVTPPGGGPPVPQLDVISTTQPVDMNGNFSLQDLNEIDFVGGAVTNGTTNCSANEIANGLVTVSVTDNTLGVIATKAVPASYWCQDNQPQLGAGCFPPPSATITLSGLSFGTTGGNLFNCGSPAQPANNQSISNEDSSGNIVVTCTPTPGSNGTFSTTPVTPFQGEVSCGDGHGAFISISCNGTGNPNDISINGSVTFSIENSCGSGIDSSNANTFPFTGLLPGAAQSSFGLASCDRFSNACATGMPCNFNDFSATGINVVNLRP
jgi:hypothetical protein